jgi:glycosyltransferase involved in cell wall biosynthesis
MTQGKAKELPLVTFALFAYNQERYIREAVDGAFSQTYEPLEIILSDDCSTDQTCKIMQEMAAGYDGPHKMRVLWNEVNLGSAGYINSIVASANGHIVCSAAGDDISVQQRTEILAKPMIENRHSWRSFDSARNRFIKQIR